MARETSVVLSSFSFLPGRLKTVNFRFFVDWGVVRVFPGCFYTPFWTVLASFDRGVFDVEARAVDMKTSRSSLFKNALFSILNNFRSLSPSFRHLSLFSTPFETWVQPSKWPVCVESSLLEKNAWRIPQRPKWRIMTRIATKTSISFQVSTREGELWCLESIFRTIFHRQPFLLAISEAFMDLRAFPSQINNTQRGKCL